MGRCAVEGSARKGRRLHLPVHVSVSTRVMYTCSVNLLCPSNAATHSTSGRVTSDIGRNNVALEQVQGQPAVLAARGTVQTPPAGPTASSVQGKGPPPDAAAGRSGGDGRLTITSKQLEGSLSSKGT